MKSNDFREIYILSFEKKTFDIYVEIDLCRNSRVEIFLYIPLYIKLTYGHCIFNHYKLNPYLLFLDVKTIYM